MKNRELKELREKHLNQRKNLFKNEEFVKEYELFEIEYAIAKILHETRIEAKITQKEIAEKMNTRQSVVSRIERGANVSIETLAKYAAACGKKVELKLV